MILTLFLFLATSKRDISRSVSTIGTLMTRMVLPGAKDPWGLIMSSEKLNTLKSSDVETDRVVMETKVKIIEILEFILNVRLDYRISSLLTIFKREFDVKNGGAVGNEGENFFIVLIAPLDFSFLSINVSGNVICRQKYVSCI